MHPCLGVRRPLADEPVARLLREEKRPVGFATARTLPTHRTASYGRNSCPLSRARTAASTAKLCKLAMGATGGFVRQCEIAGTGSLLPVAPEIEFRPQNQNRHGSTGRRTPATLAQCGGVSPFSSVYAFSICLDDSTHSICTCYGSGQSTTTHSLCCHTGHIRLRGARRSP